MRKGFTFLIAFLIIQGAICQTDSVFDENDIDLDYIYNTWYLARGFLNGEENLRHYNDEITLNRDMTSIDLDELIGLEEDEKNWKIKKPNLLKFNVHNFREKETHIYKILKLTPTRFIIEYKRKNYHLTFEFHNVKTIVFHNSLDELYEKLNKLGDNTKFEVEVKDTVVNNIKRNYINFTAKSFSNINDEDFESMQKDVEMLFANYIDNPKDFKGANFIYVDTLNNTKKAKSIHYTLDMLPIWGGCEYADYSARVLKECFYEKLGEYLQDNFDPSEVQNIGLERKKHIIYVSFMVGSDKHVTNVIVKSQNEKLKKLVIDVFESIEVAQAGVDYGKSVSVPYIIPLTFWVE